jgi:DedD protein
MADESPAKPAAEAGEATKKQLLRRVGIGAVLIVLLIGGLAVFDAYNRPAPGPVARVEPAPATPIAPPAAVPAPLPAGPAEPEKTAAPEQKSPPPAAAPAAKPVVETRPAAPAPAPKEAKPAAAPAKADDRLQLRAAPAEPAGKPQPAAGPRYMLQLGVFNHPDNARQLLAKLSGAGIAAQAETRVQVGPFATREEAETAIRKLKAIGVESTLLIPLKRP